MMRREMGTALAVVVAIAAGTASGQQVVYSNMTPDSNEFGGVNMVQSLVDSPVADDIQIVGGGTLQEISFAVWNQGGFLGGSPAPSDVTLTLALGGTGGDGLPDYAGAPFFTTTFTTDVVGVNTPTILSVDLSSFNVAIPDNALLMVSMTYSNFNFNHIKAVQGAATVGSSTDVLRPYSPGNSSQSGDLMYEITVVPAPAAMGLFGLGGLAAMRRRRR